MRHGHDRLQLMHKSLDGRQGELVRIKRDGGQITIRDQPAPFWALGLFLLSGGLVAVAMPLGLATNAKDLEPWELLASILVGIGVSTGALWWLARSPASQVQLDLTRRRLRLVRSGLSGRLVRQLSFDELSNVEVEEGSDNEGGLVWRPALRLRSGELVLLSELWSHDQAGVRAGMAAVAEACRLPLRPASEAIARGAT
jgi:hypothetical protein